MEPPSTGSRRSERRYSSQRRKPRRLQPRRRDGIDAPSGFDDTAAAPGRYTTGRALSALTLLAGAIVALRLGIPAVAQSLDSAPAASSATDSSALSTAIGVVLLLVLLGALFTMAEAALVSVRRSRIDQLIEEGNRAAMIVRQVQENPQRFVATIQVGIRLIAFAVAATAATTLARPVGPLMTRAGLDPSSADTAAVVVVTVVASLFFMVLGGIAPRALAVRAPDVWALRLSPLIRFCATLFAPLTWLVVGASNLLVRPFGAKAQFEAPAITEEELKQILETGEEAGELEEEEREMLHNVFGLGDTLVRSVMTPRIDMTAVSVDTDLTSLLDGIIASGHSRLPVYEGTIDNIVGIVHAKDLLPLIRDDKHDVELQRVMRAPYFVPETKRVSELLAEFRRSNQQLAIVQDEYAGTEGIVSIEDLLEEIVGDIRDEYDVDEPDIQVVSATESLIDGRMPIDDVNDRLGLSLPHGEYETIGGLVFSMLGHEPLPGDSVEQEGLTFLVEKIDGRRIHTLRAVKSAGEAEVAALAEAPEGTVAS